MSVNRYCGASQSAAPSLTFAHINRWLGRRLVEEALQMSEEGKFSAAIELVEQAISVDQCGALDGYQHLRVQLYWSLGKEEPERATRLYEIGVFFGLKGCMREAESAFLAADRLDPSFLWPLNNLAWLRATNRDPRERRGARALRWAKEVCARSDWNCWAFLSTLAAACAAAGDFEEAIAWQKRSLSLTPRDHRPLAHVRLEVYESGRVYVDEGDPVCAGRKANTDEVEHISVESLLADLNALLDESSGSVSRGAFPEPAVPAEATMRREGADGSRDD